MTPYLFVNEAIEAFPASKENDEKAATHAVWHDRWYGGALTGHWTTGQISVEMDTSLKTLAKMSFLSEHKQKIWSVSNPSKLR